MTNVDRIEHHLISEFGDCKLGSCSRDQLQEFLNRKAKGGLSFSTVDHLRWDIRRIFEMAKAEGYLHRNPAQLIFTPRECPRPAIQILTIEEVKKILGVLELREQLIARLAILAGMRPGEIFALTWQRLEGNTPTSSSASTGAISTRRNPGTPFAGPLFPMVGFGHLRMANGFTGREA